MSRLASSVITFFWLLGCSTKAVELDQAPPFASVPTTGDDPALVLSEEPTSVWVDERRLYWVAGGKLQSCRTTDCARSLLDYPSSVRGEDNVVTAVVAGGHVYWTSRNTIYSCPTEGCDPKPLTVTQDPALQPPPFAHGEYVYWSSDFDIYRCRAVGCSGAPDVVASNSLAQALAFDEARAYWSDGVRVMSAPVDGSAPPEIAGFDQRGAFTGDLAVGGGYLYVSDNLHIFRCPLANCDASPPTLLVTASGSGPLTQITLDGSTLYWDDADTLRSCRLPACTDPRAIATLRQGTSVGDKLFAIDTNDIYWLEPPGVGSPTIRRMAK